MNKKYLALTALIFLSGCSIFQEEKAKPLPGERIAVLPESKKLQTDSAVVDQDLGLTGQTENKQWPQNSYLPTHEGMELALNKNIKMIWSSPIGTGQSSRDYLLSTPVIAADAVYTIDAKGIVSAFNIVDGKRVWRVSVLPKGDNGENPAGAIAFENGRLFVTNGRRDIVALDAKNGGRIWKYELPAAARVAPTIANGRVYVVTLENQLIALNETNGQELWRHSGISEAASLLGGSSPAVDGDTVIATYSSGEIFALRPENGLTAWSDSLAGRKNGSMAELSDIRGNAVIQQDNVIATTFAGKLVALDRRTGERVWQQSVGSGQTPLVVGEWIFAVTPDAELVALSRKTGGVRWMKQLDRYKDKDSKDEPVTWAGPVLAGAQLWLYGSDGRLIAIDPDKGDVMASVKTEKGAGLPPIVAQSMLFVLSADGNLIAFK